MGMSFQGRRCVRVRGWMLGLGMSFLACSMSARAELFDAVVATVDKDVILYSEILAVIGSELTNLRTTATSQSEYDRRAKELVEGTLEEAIESKILVREARKYSVEVSDDEIEERIDSLRAQYDSEEEFMADLQEVGESLSDFRERTRKQIMAQRLAYSKLSSLEDEVSVTEEEILQFYQDNQEGFERPEKIYVRQIHFRVSRDSDERAEVRARLEQLRVDIEAGSDFEELAKRYSQAPGAEEGGIIGWQKRGDLRAELEDAVFALEVGGTSQVVDTPFGVHLLRLDDREAAGVATLDEVRLQIEPVIRSRAAEERYRTWLADLRKRSRVRIFL